ncbi:FAD-dependent oxidoreductase [Pseudomonas aeruginosa]|uniref:GcvT family protein n=1 Tax=Pseudomonas aeruginosa TaxID=287 RepID=UPI000DF84E0D|nr:FAD-dependent oxidoreductase [Pseudomonas aeruginosa]MCU9022842.1 FAD-dependent oxidoreductase [Pseudomonas aeruginosa]MDY1450095.1 FAD-dependent oxidoreductase [Pseudomonas aeruginosa]RDC79594.1 FAD-dependent oxidoreductase [Pseudomonas aeruginosa]HBO5586835.1 FAD-dependent oxidoreductase [Pseudomonas aeruginosa]HEP8052407.1 FAD-dependent oxidoreductase [Pseudomonas aeruginosa]
MSNSVPSSARVVIVGGGVIGCSVAYHLTKLGIKDVVLLERKTLTCGTTWHAAGLVPTLRATYNMSMLAKYSAGLYESLEAETGQATGFLRNGSLSVATTAERLTELKRGASMAKLCGFPCNVVNPEQARDLWPLLNIEDIVGGVYLPLDGMVNPVDVTQALAKGARMGGARIIENTKVLDIKIKDGKAAGVVTECGDIDAEFVVNCAGMWARNFGKKAGVNIPLHGAEHYYVVTEPMPELTGALPTLRDLDHCNYFKTDAGKLLIGTFEPNAKPWGHEGIPDSFSFDELPPDMDHLEPYLEAAIRRVPALERTGLQVFFNGPESFTPDDRYHLGEAPELRNYFVAAGFNSIGIQSAGGAGKVLAEWIAKGHAPMDLWDVDIRRNMPYQGTSKYLYDRTTEGLGLLFAMHWPFRQYETARNARKSILHEHLAKANACFGEVAGWERANFFAPEGVKPEYQYSWGKQNWFDWSAAEHRAVRENVGLFDQSSFAKIMVQGRDAMAVLNRICSNNIDVESGRIVYTQWLNERGGIEADLTVTRLAADAYLVVTGPATQVRELNWLKRNIPSDARVVVTDVTSSMAVLSVMGPKSRALLQSLTEDDLSNEGFPFATSREIELGYARVRASRITYVGELGWEIYIPTEFAPDVFDRIAEAGKAFDLKLCGYHALNSLRIEKGYRHFGHDVMDEDTPLEAGLAFASDFNKEGGFIGKEALLAQKAVGVKRRMVLFKFLDPEALSHHEEPILRNGVIVGRTTSGMYGHHIGGNVAMGYVRNDAGVTLDWIKEGEYEIEVACQRYKVEASVRAFYDPDMSSIKC